MQKKIITAAAETHSYVRATLVLDALAEVEISSRQINRITDNKGERLREQQRQRVEDFQKKKLPVKVSNHPDLAVVEFDGGRIRTQETGQGSGTHDPAWKESKTAFLCPRCLVECRWCQSPARQFISQTSNEMIYANVE